MRLKVLKLIIAIVGLGAFSMVAQTPYNTLEVKAQRYMTYKEWGSALAMYELMMAQKPDVASNYSQSILLSGLLSDEPLQETFMHEVVKRAIPFDSIFDGVRRGAVGLNRPEVYVNFLNLVKVKHAWMSRTIDLRLLSFAVFRGDADSTIEIANRLLVASPNNIEFLRALGNAHLLKGDYQNAIYTMHEVLKTSPNDVPALLTIGNFYVMDVKKQLSKVGLTLEQLPNQRTIKEAIKSSPAGEGIVEELRRGASTAQEYLVRAAAIESTPYLRDTIKNVEQLLGLLP